MFDVLLSFVEKNQVMLIQLLLKSIKENGDGVLAISKDNNKVDVRYYTPDKFPYENIKEEYEQKKKNTVGDKIEVTDKWIVTLPILEIETDEKTTIPVWNLILDTGKEVTFFQGFPQEVDIEKDEKGLQYVLVGEPHGSTFAKNNWSVEATTNGQNYIKACSDSSKNLASFLTFRSNSDYCKIILPGTKEEGQQILKRVGEMEEFTENIKNFRKNDDIGSPMIYKYKKFGKFSPNTLKYINTMYELQQHFNITNMDNAHIAELGGGYGGLCHILSYVMKWDIYTFIEIQEPLDLAKKCLSQVPSIENVQFHTPDEEVEEKWDLFISEYSFCELNKEGIEKHIHMLKSCKNAYLTMNLWDKQKKRELKSTLLTIFNTIEEYPTFLKSEWGDYVWVCRNEPKTECI